jgi:hypothetical protein
MRAHRAVCLLSLLLIAGGAVPARAQGQPPVGVRAAGMGSAFTAVADDASAAFWNPAGLATGAFFSLAVDRNTLDNRSATLIALGTPPLGITYYRTATRELAMVGNALVAHHAGVTLLQSVGDRFAVGATLKVVRGTVSSPSASLATTRFDTDLGVITTGSFARLGLSVRNLTEPAFKVPGGGTAKLERQVRAGISLNTSRKTIAAADIDLTTTATARGDWREAALGLEANPLKKAWIRGGVHWNTTGDVAAPVGTLGGSFAVYGSTVADAQVSFGSSNGDRGWGIGLRFVF